MNDITFAASRLAAHRDIAAGLDAERRRQIAERTAVPTTEVLPRTRFRAPSFGLAWLRQLRAGGGRTPRPAI